MFYYSILQYSYSTIFMSIILSYGFGPYAFNLSTVVAGIVPNAGIMPTKTPREEEFIAGLRYRNSLLVQIESAFFQDLWVQKQKMKKFVKRQQALETVVSRVCGSKRKSVRKKNDHCFWRC